MPPGGPEDFEPPKVTQVRPDTNAVNVRGSGVTFRFDEVVSERPQGAPNLAGLFLISPSAGEPSVSWRRTQVTVSPRGGFRPGTTYSVRMLPGLADLEGNSDSTGQTVVFSTGATLATGRLSGIVFDWPAEKPAPQAFVEAIPLPASRDTLRYLTVADSQGRFDLAHVPPGRFLLRASIDQNKNRLLDPRELYDTMTVTLVDSLRREILAYVHDTLGAGIQTVTIQDSMTLRVQLDRALDTAFVIDTSRFTLKRADSTVVRVTQALTRRQFEQEREDSIRTRAIQDSIQSAARADSARAADTTQAPPPRPVTTRRTLPPRPGAALDTARLAARADTAPTPRPSVPAPVDEVYLRLADPLRPATGYRLRAFAMRTLLGHVRTSERVFTTPRARPVADSLARARRDSIARDTSRARRDSIARARGDSTRRPDTIGVAARQRGTHALARRSLPPFLAPLPGAATVVPSAARRR